MVVKLLQETYICNMWCEPALHYKPQTYHSLVKYTSGSYIKCESTDKLLREKVNKTSADCDYINSAGADLK